MMLSFASYRSNVTALIGVIALIKYKDIGIRMFPLINLNYKNQKVFFNIIFVLIAVLLSRTCCAQNINNGEPNNIFKLEPQFSNKNLDILLDIAPGHAIYKNKLNVTSYKDSKDISSLISIPIKNITSIGLDSSEQMPGYEGQLLIQIEKNKLPDDKIILTYQGCSIKDEICYLPIAKIISWNEDKSIVILEDYKSGSKYNITTSNTTDNETNSTSWFDILSKVILFIFIGSTIAFTPCTFPLIPILLNSITRNSNNMRKSAAMSISYVIGIGVAYAIIGLGVNQISSNLQHLIQQSWVIYTFSAFLAIMSLISLDIINADRLSAENYLVAKLENKLSKGVAPIFLMGIISVLMISPCTTPALAGVLVTITQLQATNIQAIILLFSFGIGSGIPLLLMALLGHKVLPKSGKWLLVVRDIVGLSILAIAVWLVSKLQDNIISQLLWSVYLYFAFFFIRIKSYNKIKLISFAQWLIVISATIFAISAGVGKNLSFKQINNFPVVKSEKHLSKIIQNSQSENKFSLIKVTADWCVYCKQLDKDFFQNKSFQNLISSSPINIIQADVTDGIIFHSYISDKWGVSGVPSVIIIDINGNLYWNKSNPSIEELDSIFKKIAN